MEMGLSEEFLSPEQWIGTDYIINALVIAIDLCCIVFSAFCCKVLCLEEHLLPRRRPVISLVRREI
jgi:hypothetical protein